MVGKEGLMHPAVLPAQGELLTVKGKAKGLFQGWVRPGSRDPT